MVSFWLIEALTRASGKWLNWYGRVSCRLTWIVVYEKSYLPMAVNMFESMLGKPEAMILL
jgi:hypothetical protein